MAYPLMNHLLNSAANPQVMVWFQIVLEALSVWTFVIILGRRHTVLSLLIGILFLVDFDWASQSRWILTESPFISLNLLALACLLSHFERRRSLKNWELVLAGFLYGWVTLFRPASIFLAFPIPLLYFWLLRAWKKTALVCAGIVILWLIGGLYNVAQTGKFQLFGGTGIYLYYPLFWNQLFSPDNGPTSQQIDQTLRSCKSDISYTQINLYVDILPCLKENGIDWEKASAMLVTAYREAALRRPALYAQRLFEQSSRFLTYPIPSIVQEGFLDKADNTNCQGHDWCTEDRAQKDPQLKNWLTRLVQSAVNVTRWTTQP